MPSMGDSVFIFLLALILFGPKKLPQLARQLGKLMAEFRKASNDFRMQMEDELHIEEQKEHQAKVNALAPPPSATPNPDIPTEDPPHPHLPATTTEAAAPIAESGDLKMMPPSSGLPMQSASRGQNLVTQENTDLSIHSGLLEQSQIGAGLSSEEPLADAVTNDLADAPDRSQPVMAGEGERATHV